MQSVLMSVFTQMRLNVSLLRDQQPVMFISTIKTLKIKGDFVHFFNSSTISLSVRWEKLNTI